MGITEGGPLGSQALPLPAEGRRHPSVDEDGQSPILRRDPVEARVREYVDDYLRNSAAAAFLAERLSDVGVGFLPLVDHITLRTLDVEARAGELLDLGFAQDTGLGVLAYGDWWAKVYRKPGLPAVFVDQAYVDERGASSVIPPWVEHFGDRVLHHVAVRVEDIETAVERLQDHGHAFSEEIIGHPGSDLRQIFSRPQERDGHPFTVLELIERHRGYAGFSPPAADGLMRSTAPRA